MYNWPAVPYIESADVIEARRNRIVRENEILAKMSIVPTSVTEYMEKLRKCARCETIYAEKDNIAEWNCMSFHPGRYERGRRVCCGDSSQYTDGCARSHHTESHQVYAGISTHAVLAVPVHYLQTLVSGDNNFGSHFLMTPGSAAQDQQDGIMILGHLAPGADSRPFKYAPIVPNAARTGVRKNIEYRLQDRYKTSWLFETQPLVAFVKKRWRDFAIRAAELDEYRAVNAPVQTATIDANGQNFALTGPSRQTEEDYDAFRDAMNSPTGIDFVFIQRFEFPTEQSAW